MAQVRVAKFTVFDMGAKTERPSAQYATLTTISVIGGTPLPDSFIWVDESDLDSVGMTKPGFVPKS
jgi:hypothetical protein